MSRYGETFLTKPRWYSSDYQRVDRSDMQFRPVDGVELKWSLSLLGVINGFPILSWFWSLQCVLDDDRQIISWRIGRWQF